MLKVRTVAQVPNRAPDFSESTQFLEARRSGPCEVETCRAGEARIAIHAAPSIDRMHSVNATAASGLRKEISMATCVALAAASDRKRNADGELSNDWQCPIVGIES